MREFQRLAASSDKALRASIDASRIDQRAWVGLDRCVTHATRVCIMVEAMILAVDPGYVLRWDELCRELG